MILKKILSVAASIIKLFIFILFFNNSNAEENNIKYFPKEVGTLSLMYHRFDEEKYPATNIAMDIFKKQMKIITENNLSFYDPNEFNINFNKSKKENNGHNAFVSLCCWYFSIMCAAKTCQYDLHTGKSLLGK